MLDFFAHQPDWAALASIQSGPARNAQPVAIVGPRDATPEQLAAAHHIAQHLGRAGIPLVCGGKQGVMAAASEGAHTAGGVVVGLLPEDDTAQANPWLTVALPTGLGITRNALVARSARCLVAIGGGLGTLSEMALARQWGKPVLCVLGAPQVDGCEIFDSVQHLLDAMATHLMPMNPLPPARLLSA